MRLYFVVGLSLVTLVLFTSLLKQHIHTLLDSARTYATFYPYLTSHPDTVLRYPTDLQNDIYAQNSISISQPIVPPRLHQRLLSEHLPNKLDKYASASQSCRELHPDWTYNIWTDDTATSFMRRHYPDILPHYLGYPHRSQRANILRYAILHHYGRFYLDVDITCTHPLDRFLNLPWLSPAAHPAGVNNAFIVSRPGHPVLSSLLDSVPSRNLRWGMPYIENTLSTGCMFFSNRWMDYARSLSADTPEDARLYVLADEGGDLNTHMLRGKVTTPLMIHGGSSSWHSWDASVIVILGKYYRLVLLSLVLVTCSAALCAVKVWKGKLLIQRHSYASSPRHSMSRSTAPRLEERV